MLAPLTSLRKPENAGSGVPFSQTALTVASSNGSPPLFVFGFLAIFSPMVLSFIRFERIQTDLAQAAGIPRLEWSHQNNYSQPPLVLTKESDKSRLDGITPAYYHGPPGPTQNRLVFPLELYRRLRSFVLPLSKLVRGSLSSFSYRPAMPSRLAFGVVTGFD
jgi:hypothetical protein